MAGIADYDALLTAIYEAGEGGRPLGEMLDRIARELDVVVAGFQVYDDSGRQVTHSILAPVRTAPVDWQRRLGDINDDPGIRAISRTPLLTPRRFSDLVPGGRLHNAGWFRKQVALVGVGYGMAIDLDLAGLRVRMFAMRGADAPDFESASLDMLGRIACHVERAFATAPHLLAPHRLGADAAALVYRREEFAGAMREDQPLERRLADRFGLTPAEARVALAAARGDARAGTAERLGISLNSIKTHLRRVHSKLGISRAAELVRAVEAVKAGR